MPLPRGLKKIGEAIHSQPIPQPPAPQPAEWQASKKRDSVTYYEGEAAAEYFDEITPAMRTGFDIEAALIEARHERHRAQKEAAKSRAPEQIPFRPSPAMSEAFERLMDERREQNR